MKNNSSPINGNERSEEILLGLESYFSEMAPVTRSEAERYESKALESFSPEDLALL